MVRVMNLREALEALGNDTEAVARTLVDKGIHGFRKHPYHCPVSNYLRSCGFKSVNVGTQKVYVGEGVSSYSQDLPSAVSRFIIFFDEGLYPEIYER